MPERYRPFLEAVIRRLEHLRDGGTQFVTVKPQTLNMLVRPRPTRSTKAAADRLAKPATAARSATAVVSPGPAPIRSSPHPSAPVEVALLSEIGKALTPAEKEQAMATLRNRALACRKCLHLAASRRNVVFGVGNIHSPLMFVGEAPGADEDIQGEPFVGKAGQLLTRIIQTMGFKRESIYIANILKCRPDTPGQAAGNRKPTPEEMKTCLPYLAEQIDIIQPRVIVALGATAVEGLLGKTAGITRLRGNWQVFRGIPVMPTYHPAFLLRNQSPAEKRKVWEDMLQVLEKLGLTVTEKQRGYFLSDK